MKAQLDEAMEAVTVHKETYNMAKETHSYGKSLIHKCVEQVIKAQLDEAMGAVQYLQRNESQVSFAIL